MEVPEIVLVAGVESNQAVPTLTPRANIENGDSAGEGIEATLLPRSVVLTSSAAGARRVCGYTSSPHRDGRTP